MSRSHRILSILILSTLLVLTFTTPAYAYDGRGGDKVVIAADQVVNDDLYVGAKEFVLDGTANGDVIAFAQFVTVNGTINGDLITAAQTIVINGIVTGSVKAAGSVLYFGDKAKIGGDLVGAGYSLESRSGSAFGRDLVFAAGQILLGGNIVRNVTAYSGALQIDGNIGGNVKAEVGDASQTQAGPPPSMFMGPSTVPVPLVKPGLSIDPSAMISGNLEYTQKADLTFPAGVVAGQVTRVTPPTPEKNGTQPSIQETTRQKVTNWIFGSARSLITLILFGLFLLWLFPILLKGISEKLGTQPWPSMGWGVITYAGFFFAVLLIIFVTILGALLFGVLTLGGLSGTIVWLGILTLFAIILGFVLATSFLAKIIFGMTLGKWILLRAKSPLAEHKFWPMVIGVAVIVAVISFLSFPLVPGLLAGLLNIIIILFGLGALWLRGREMLTKKEPITAS